MAAVFTARPNLKLEFIGNAVQNISFTSDIGRNDIDLGAWDDQVKARGEGHYNGGTGNDTIDFNNMRHMGITLDKQARTVTWGNGKELTYELFEVVKWNSGQNGITVLGDGAGETMRGSTDYWVQEIFDGRGGNDILKATGGNDILTGGAGSDTFYFSTPGSVTMVTDFERGVDTLHWTWLNQSSQWQENKGNDVWLWYDNYHYATLKDIGPGAVEVSYDYFV